MTKEERDYATEHLTATANETMKAIEGLSQEQFKFKQNPENWSVEECLKHIMLAELNIWGGFVGAPMANEPDASRRSQVKMTDAEVAGMFDSRAHKLTALDIFDPELRPENVEITIKEFKELRDEHINWTKKTDADLRDHYAETPFGIINVYQAVIFMSAHTRRHVKQIMEVMASPNFSSKLAPQAL